MNFIKKFANIRFWGIILMLFLPAAILYLDFWIYTNYVSSERLVDEELERAFLLNTPLLQKISQELENKKEFLRSPVYPEIKKSF